LAFLDENFPTKKFRQSRQSKIFNGMGQLSHPCLPPTTPLVRGLLENKIRGQVARAGPIFRFVCLLPMIRQPTNT